MKKSYNKGEDNHFNTHGKSRSRLYSIWKDMKSRCLNVKHKSFHNYGGRGITICEEWITDFESFQSWAVSNGYTDDLQIDRLDNNDGYSRYNCRFITHAENSRNRRDTKLDWDKVKIIRELSNTKEYTQKDIAKMFNVSCMSINYIINNKTWKEQL